MRKLLPALMLLALLPLVALFPRISLEGRGERRQALRAANLTEALISNALTIVLAARRRDAGGFPRLPSLMRSLTKYLSKEMVLEMLLCVPDGDVGLFNSHAAFQALPWPLVIVPDSRLLSRSEVDFQAITPRREWEAHHGRGTNYRMQMLAKIRVALLVRSSFYLLLDCDVIATRRTSFDDLIPRGRGLYMAVPRDYRRHEASWWVASDAVLRADSCVTGSSAPVIGVTPALLSTIISRGLVRAVPSTPQPAALLLRSCPRLRCLSSAWAPPAAPRFSGSNRRRRAGYLPRLRSSLIIPACLFRRWRVLASSTGRTGERGMWRSSSSCRFPHAVTLGVRFAHSPCASIPWQEGLNWTEYTLYWTFACLSGLADAACAPN